MKSNGEKNFIENLKDKKCASIHAAIKKFVNEDFKKVQNLEKSEISKKVQDFISQLILDYVKVCKISFGQSSNVYNEICDGFEGIITKALYNKIFCSTASEKEDDYKFEKTLKKYTFISPKNLDIDESIIDHVYLEVAINKLSMINQFRTPKDKIIILLNFCNILAMMIDEQAKKNRGGKGEKFIIGADEVFPLVVYAISKGNIRKLKSNMVFIKEFRHHTRLESTEEYYFTTIDSAINFIQNDVTHKKLNIDREDEFLNIIADAQTVQYAEMKNIISFPVFRRNNDENCLLYFLNENKKAESEIELTDLKQNILLNTDSVISKSLMYNNNTNPLLNVDLEKLYKEYFNGDFVEFSIGKLEKMFNDFKIILRLISSFKQAYYKGRDSPSKYMIDKSKSNRKIYTDDKSSNNLIDL